MAVNNRYKTDTSFCIRKDVRNNRLVIKAHNPTDIGNELAIIDDESITSVGNSINIRFSTRVNADIVYDIDNSKNRGSSNRLDMDMIMNNAFAANRE